jgi:hypothetical protein
MRPVPSIQSTLLRIPWLFLILATASLLLAAGFACTAITAPGKASATPPPTGQINAIEVGTPAQPVDKKNWQVWAGTILSQTSRQYMSDGSPVNTCETNWETNFLFTIDPVGNISGIGYADLTDGPTCSPHPISGNTTHMTISVSGRKDDSAIYLNVGVSEFEPMPSADFGGYILLNSNGACPPVAQSIEIPMTSPTTAQAQLNLNATMTGCAGSMGDQMSNQSQADLHFDFICSDNPFNPSDPEAQICK